MLKRSNATALQQHWTTLLPATSSEPGLTGLRSLYTNVAANAETLGSLNAARFSSFFFLAITFSKDRLVYGLYILMERTAF